MANIGDSLRQTVSDINDELSKSMKSLNNSISTTYGGQPVFAYGLAGFTIIVLSVMIMRSKESDTDTSLLGAFSSKETSAELAEQTSEETLEPVTDLENQQVNTDSSDFSLFGNMSPSQEKKDDDNLSTNIFSNQNEEYKSSDDVSGISSTDFNLDSIPEEQMTSPEEQMTSSDEQVRPPDEQVRPPDEQNKPLEEQNKPLEEQNKPLEEPNKIGGKKKKSKKNRKSKRKYTKKRY
jgi:hypothetical protein